MERSLEELFDDLFAAEHAADVRFFQPDVTQPVVDAHADS